MNILKKTVDDIKNLKIQGAENVALQSVNCIKKLNSMNYSFHKLKVAKDRLFNVRPTEPMLRNSLNYIFKGITDKNTNLINERISYVLNHFEYSKKHIIEVGKNIITKNCVVYTHCHSGTVTSILKSAKKEGTKFSVNNTETRPLYQGRITAIELINAGINVNHFIDSAMRLAIKNSDMVLIGSDAITTTKIYNKIGSELVCETANRFNIPVYVCTDSWKFDLASVTGKEELIEERNYKEVWNKRLNKLKVFNPAFEKIDPVLVEGIISELGLLKHGQFLEEFNRVYSKML